MKALKEFIRIDIRAFQGWYLKPPNYNLIFAIWYFQPCIGNLILATCSLIVDTLNLICTSEYILFFYRASQNIIKSLFSFSPQYWVKLGPKKKDNNEFSRLKTENIFFTLFLTPCKKAKHFQRCKDIDKSVWILFPSITF